MEQALLNLSPSSAGDFKSCPLKFKFRSIDRLPEPTSTAAARGSLVHAVLERLFAERPQQRTPERAESLLDALWNEVRKAPEVRRGEEGVGIRTPSFTELEASSAALKSWPPSSW